MKVKVRFLYHKGKGEFRWWPPRVVGIGIVLWTGFLALFYNWKCLKFPYSHEEVWIADKDGNFVIGAWIDYKTRELNYTVYIGRCFSSTTRGKANGVRFAPASEVLKHPERWDYIECEVDAERLEVVVEEAKRLVGLKYDYWGIFGFLNPIPFQNERRWYCSEICDWFKYLTRIIPKRNKRISPRRAAYLLSKVWGQPKPLAGE